MSRTVKNAFFYLLLALMALAFFAPFYFMLVGAFQQNPTNTPSDLLPTDGWTLQNFVSINQRISLLRSIANSLVFALGVLAGTLSFWLLPGYAIARLQWRGSTSR